MVHDEDEDGLAHPPEYTDGYDRLLALCSYHAERADQLNIKSGDLVRLIERNENGWYTLLHLSNGQVGTAPAKIFAVYDPPPENQLGDERATPSGIREFHDQPTGDEETRTTTHNVDVKRPFPANNTPSPRDVSATGAYPQAPPEVNSPSHVPTNPVREQLHACEERIEMLGEEQSNESSVWAIYVSTAADYDVEMVERWNKNLDVLLLFGQASLFSAVVTSFVIQSATLLQPDYGQVNALLTAHILSVLSNAGNASWMASVPPPDQIMANQVSRLAQVVNTIWFAALGLSLSAVLVAMLAKQWLTAYLLEQKADPHQKACERQRRYDALYKWSLPYVMVALPAVLHVSLFLFLAGLIVFVWQLNAAVSAALCVILAMLCCVYFLTAFMAMLNPECPYNTPATEYFRTRVAPYLHRFQSLKKKSTPTSEKLLATRALMWLATTRNSASASASLQAMSGLRRGFVGYDTAQAANIAKLALERLRNCFSPDWKYQDAASYTCRDEISLSHASRYARTLMHFLDDPRATRPSEFASILADPALPIFLQTLGTSANPNYALLGLCDYQRLLHRREVARFHSVKERDGRYDSQQAGQVIRARPSVENMLKIVHLLGRYLDGSVFLHNVAIEIAIETLGFAPLAWICAVSGSGDISIEDMLLPLLRIRKQAQHHSITGIRLALASTFSILAAVHQADKLPDAADDLSLRFETALAAASAVRHDLDLEEIRSILLPALSYFLKNHTGSRDMINLLYKELCRECDTDIPSQGPDFSDKVAVQSLLPLLLAPSLQHEEKGDVVTRLQALATSAALGFNADANSIMFNITPRDPFPPDAVNALIAVLCQNKDSTPS
ncbi:hypothetical protein HWV62_2476 [Athelia sp. TMB]|nr:hypothetical protein HWV62_2476 [Athelia sp. TMB]